MWVGEEFGGLVKSLVAMLIVMGESGKFLPSMYPTDTRNLAGVGQMNAALFCCPTPRFMFLNRQFLMQAIMVLGIWGQSRADFFRTEPCPTLAISRESGMHLAARGFRGSRECSWLPEASAGVGNALGCQRPPRESVHV